jgi:hypothetical protein
MPFVWVAITLPLLLMLQRWIHRHLHGISYLITGNKHWAVLVYAIILFPGVLLHELSHWLAATLLGVRTGTLSLLPQVKKDGTIQLGYVEYYKDSQLGPIRESLVGGAPLFTGTAAILLMGFYVFGLTEAATAVQEGSIDSLAVALGQIVSTSDFFLWLYLLFAVSNAMMPSQSDRRAWPAFVTILAVVGFVLYLFDLQQYLVRGLAGPVATVFGYLGLAFSITIAVNLFVMGFLYIVESIIGRLKGVELVYNERDVSKFKTS